MAVVKYTNEELKLLARLMRAEAEGEGKQGMLLVGNVGVNRVRARCLDFTDIRTIEQMVYQRPGGFESTLFSYFYQPARSADVKLAKRCVNGEQFSPAQTALWFYATDGNCSSQWWGQWNSGKYKKHCFYSPVESQNCY